MAGRIILLADMESFYASVETARRPSLRGKPVVVCGDPERRHGIVLAASKEAKAWGIKTGMLAGECRSLCRETVFVRPHMSLYIQVSLQITDIFRQYTDRIFPYSIDEQFLDMSGCEKLFGPPREMAARINSHILEETGVRSRIGIGDNLLQAKMACDNFAKKAPEGIFRLTGENYAAHTGPLPIRCLFGVGSRMERNLHRIGITTIGDLAGLPVENLKRRWGINGEVLWLNARGIDYAGVHSLGQEGRKGVGHAMTLPRDYMERSQINVVLLEITEEVCRRARALGKVGRVVNVYCRGADFDFPTGFSRQKKLPEPTAQTMDIYPVVLQLFYTFWDRQPVRTLGVGLSSLMESKLTQLTLFEDREKKLALSRTMDTVRNRFGATSIFRLSSLSPGSQLFERATKIGGHEA